MLLGVSRPTVIKWLKPGWRDEWDEVVRRMDAGNVTPIRLTDDGIPWTPEAVAVGASGGKTIGSMRGAWRRFLPELWSRLSRSYSYDIAPKSPMCQTKNEAMAMTTPTADATTTPFSSPLVRRIGLP